VARAPKGSVMGAATVNSWRWSLTVRNRTEN
jgi:hypothetical protein